MSPQIKNILKTRAIVAVISIVIGCLGLGFVSIIVWFARMNPAPTQAEIELAKPDWEKPPWDMMGPNAAAVRSAYELDRLNDNLEAFLKTQADK
jgi:hypothetical protein